MITEEQAAKSFAKIEDGRHVLFVCTGNTCRSPMAEAVFNRFYGGEENKAIAKSAGLFADGSSISANAEKALSSIGIAGFTHISKTVSEEMLQEADLVVGITKGHASRLMLAYPMYASKITALPIDIPDPYGGDEKEYKECLNMILRALREMFGEGNKEE